MAIINSGFDGSVTELNFARIMRGSGLRASVGGTADWKVSQGTGRQVSVAAGTAYATGVVSDSDAAQLVSLPTPVNGQWHLIVRRINWASNTVTAEAIPHTVTSTTIPTEAPTTFPTFNDNAGVILDQFLGWAWVRSTDETVRVFDLRALNTLTDAAPIGLTLQSGWTLASGSALRVSGSRVYGSIQLTRSTVLGAGTSTVAAVIDAAGWPTAPIFFPSAGTGTTPPSGEAVQVSASGAITVYTNANHTSFGLSLAWERV